MYNNANLNTSHTIFLRHWNIIFNDIGTENGHNGQEAVHRTYVFKYLKSFGENGRLCPKTLLKPQDEHLF
jgi:hypothetical protein